jgi:hypothetical protein
MFAYHDADLPYMEIWASQEDSAASDFDTPTHKRLWANLLMIDHAARGPRDVMAFPEGQSINLIRILVKSLVQVVSFSN